jgi:MerR family redox-sensitive transcriptional activator SoxR
MAQRASLTIGETAMRAGLSVATLRYYEQRGLITAERTGGNQRRYARHTLRRLAFVAAAQRVGLTLEQTAAELRTLPDDRAPTRADWKRLSGPWREEIAVRIAELQELQNTLDGCLGCGCLSLTHCQLYNPDDEARREGPGSRWVRNARRAGTE